MPIVAQQKNEILPLNMPANNAYSFKDGSSLIQLLIPEAPTMLLTKTLKLNGKLRLNRSTSTFSNPVFPDNINNMGGGAYAMRLNERVGINSLFDTITISGLGSGGQTLESVRNLGRLLALTKPLQHEQGEFDGHLQGKDPAVASRTLVGAVDCNTEVFFSIPLEVGMFSGVDAIPIGVNGTRGLQILIQLQNDANAIICSEADKGAVFYSLLDCSLTYDTLQFDAETTDEMNRPKTGQMEYNSWAHQYSVINASDTQLNLNFGTKKTLSVISNTIPTTHINNVDKDGFSTDMFQNIAGGVYVPGNVELNKITFGKDGIKVPLDYELDCKSQSQAERPRVEVIDNLKSAVDVRGSARTLVSVNTENDLRTKVNLNGDEVALLDPGVNVQTQSNPVFGIGINEDSLTDVGRDFSNSTWSVRIESNLNGASPNSINTFTLSKNTLTYSPQGISVSS